MNLFEAPPPALDWARVIAYAFVDADVKWTGRQCLIVGGEKLGPVPRLAICKNIFGELKDFLLFHCNEKWEVVGIAGAPTIEELCTRAEGWYAGMTEKWIYTETTEEEVERWLRAEYSGVACSFCGKLPVEVDGMFSNESSSSNICYECIRDMRSSMGL